MRTLTVVTSILILIGGILVATVHSPLEDVPGGSILRFLANTWVPFSFSELLVLALLSALHLVFGFLALAFGIAMFAGFGSAPQGEFSIGFVTIPCTILGGGLLAAGGAAGIFRTAYFAWFLVSATHVPLSNAHFDPPSPVGSPNIGWLVKGNSARITDVENLHCLLMEADSSVTVDQPFSIASKKSCRLRYHVRSQDSLMTGLAVVLYFHQSGHAVDSLYKTRSDTVEPEEWTLLVEEFDLPDGIDEATISFQVTGGRRYWLDNVEIML